MKVCQILICCFFLSLQEGNTAQTSVYPGTEGGNVTVSCRYPALGTWKYFCKGEYGRWDILVETIDDTAQRGRYSIRYVQEPRAAVLDVTITQLTKSDSGRYGCGLDRTELLYKAFEVIVVDASASPAFPVTHRVMLYVGLTLVVMVILLLVAWLIFCRKRICKPEEPPVESEYASVKEANPTYEEIREVERQSRSPPEGISSVYAYTKYTNPN
ncbi:uncharacterized protein LOC130174276 isoform X1 [Seriola aureovittata]|uniref:uncharacterized protein LOC130174276 isoform X1 n=1 Tax=Seriola aureovittata TaxID=2871759 RepID=UPI0024BEFDC9|nr:uncharacterized protein LOC130174276 isoform X1 [Seriola aureovittata]